VPTDRDRKVKSRRIHEKQVKIAKQMRIAKINGIPVKHPNKLGKQHAADCGRAGCQLCNNPRRTRGEKTIQELRAEQK
jgi:hypothetical protein